MRRAQYHNAEILISQRRIPSLKTAGTPLAPTQIRPRRPTYRIFVRDLIVPWEIGIHDHERGAVQRVRINLDLSVREADRFDADRYRQVVCYAGIVEDVQRLAAEGHINLVETLASRVAALCLADRRVEQVTVRAEKLDALDDVGSVGVEITRANTKDPA
jgi:dihydroneopterin aldolase